MEVSLSYSVIQSDGNSFGGDVVLDKVDMAFSYKDSILDLIYEKQIFSDLNYTDFKFLQCWKKMHI